MLGAIIATVVVFWLLLRELPNKPATQTTLPEVVMVPETAVETVGDYKIPPEGIPLNTLPITDTQRSALMTAGIDVDNTVITPAMYTCAEGKLGAIRMDEIIAGDRPTLIDTMKLTPCLSVE